MTGTIYAFIKEQESGYQKPIQLEEGWNWSMKEHLRKSFLYKNFQFAEQNDNRDLRPNKNIVLGIRNLQNRTEGFDVKDIDLYIGEPDENYKSFLVQKFHNRWAKENFIDTFIDETVDSYGDYGATLARDTANSRPEVIHLRSLAFCNQTDILAYPFAIKHHLSFSQLREWGEEYGWGEASNGATIDIEGLIQLCKDEKEIIVYETHGNLPIEWLSDKRDSEESKKDIKQIQVNAYYKDQNKNETGVTLFRKREPKLPFKLLKRDKIEDRALGRGGIEELFESQQWTNWNEIKITEMLEAASKMINLTDDPSVVSKHPSGLKNLTNLEFVQVGEGKKGVWQMDNTPRNLVVFDNAMSRWAEHAREIGAASQELLSGETKSGMPFKLFEAKTIEDKSMHKFRQGQIAVFIEQIYRDWIIPHLEDEIIKDQKFLASLSGDEMMKIGEQMAENYANRYRNEQVLNGDIPTEKESLKQEILTSFNKGGNKKFITILKGEMKKGWLKVEANIANKQKDLALLTDKVVNVVKQYLATPQIRQDPEMTKLLNIILESSGLSPIMFGAAPMATMQPGQGGTESLNQLSQVNQQANAQ